MSQDIGAKAKIILLTRDPIERFLASIKLLKTYNKNTYNQADFEADVVDVIRTMPGWVDVQKNFNDYQGAIDRYSKYFDDIFVISYEDLIHNPKSIKNKLETFLDLELDSDKFFNIVEEYKSLGSLTSQTSPATLKLLGDINRDYLSFYKEFYGATPNRGSVKVKFTQATREAVEFSVYEIDGGIVFEPINTLDCNKSNLSIDGTAFKLTLVRNRVAFLIPLDSFKIINTETNLIIDGVTSYLANWEEVFNHPFDIIKKSIDSNTEDSYRKIHNSFFVPNARNFVQNHGYYLLLSFFNQVSKTHSSYLGCLSLLAYRYMDSPNNRKKLFDKVIEERLNLNGMELPTEHHIRWFISSGCAIAVISTALGKLQQAEELIESFMLQAAYIERYPIVAMNYYSAILLYACLRMSATNDDKELLQITNVVFEGSKKSINYIFSKSHSAILGQITDCKTLLHIGANALTMQQAFTSANPQIWQTSNRFSFKLAFPRFSDDILKSYFFKSFEERVNNDYLK